MVGDPPVDAVSGVNLICAATFIAGRYPGALAPDLQARLGVGPMGAGRGSVECGQAARPATRVLRTRPRSAWAPQGDRRDGPQARDPVLAHAQTRRGLRAPTSGADQDKLRELELTAGANPRTKAAAGIWSINRAIPMPNGL